MSWSCNLGIKSFCKEKWHSKHFQTPVWELRVLFFFGGGSVWVQFLFCVSCCTSRNLSKSIISDAWGHRGSSFQVYSTTSGSPMKLLWIWLQRWGVSWFCPASSSFHIQRHGARRESWTFNLWAVAYTREDGIWEDILCIFVCDTASCNSMMYSQMMSS